MSIFFINLKDRNSIVQVEEKTNRLQLFTPISLVWEINDILNYFCFKDNKLLTEQKYNSDLELYSAKNIGIKIGFDAKIGSSFAQTGLLLDLVDFTFKMNSFNIRSQKNKEKIKSQMVHNEQRTSCVIDLFTNIAVQHLHNGQMYQAVKSSFIVSILRQKANDLQYKMMVGKDGGQFQVPPFCSMLNQKENYLCQNKDLIARLMIRPQAPIGFNGDNETFIENSAVISLDFSELSGNLINIKESSFALEVTIPRSSKPISFKHVNATSINLLPASQFMPNSFRIIATNASIHINIKPEDSSIGYLVYLKFGYMPIVNLTYADYDDFKILCPNSSESFSIYKFLIDIE
jgi:hypothetical protein